MLGVGGDVEYGGWEGVRFGGGQGGCERRIEVFGKIQKPEDQWSCKRSPDILDVNVMLGVGGDVGYGEWEGVRFGGGQGGCERRIEVFGKIQQVAQRATIAHLTTSKYF